MKMAGIREIRSNTATFFGSHDPVLVTRHGKVSGVYIPLDQPNDLPDDLAREVARNLGVYLSRSPGRRAVSPKKTSKAILMPGVAIQD